MAISATALQSKLEAWGKSSDGKRRIDTFTSNVSKHGIKLSNGTEIIGTQKMDALAQQLIITIQKWLPHSISDIGMHSSPVRKNLDGSHSVDIYFDQEDLNRESLYEEEYPDGIENIVALLNNGMEAKDTVYGWWDGHKPTGDALSRSLKGDEDYAFVPSRKFRHPLWFMQDAVFEFESITGQKYNLRVNLSDDYTDNHHWKQS